MEKIKQKPIETLKTVIIAILTVTMLVLAAVYIGGSQFTSGTAALSAKDLPEGAVPVGKDAPVRVAVYEKDLLPVSFTAICYEDIGGGAYSNEQAAQDLMEFAAEPVHACLSASATLSRVSVNDFQNVLSGNRYIYISLASKLPYQIIYALTGEYVGAVGSADAVSPECMLISFAEDGKTSLYLKDKDRYYLCSSEFYANLSEISAIANDARLLDFEITEGAVALSYASPHTHRLTLREGEMPFGEALGNILTLLDYDSTASLPSNTALANAVAPHGTLRITSEKLLYTAANDGGLPLSAFLESAKSELDIDMYDVLLACVSLVERLQNACAASTGATFTPYLSGFYHSDDTFTVVFGLADNSIAISGEALPHLARISVQGGKFKSIELRFIGAERHGSTTSLFPSVWEYNYAAKKTLPNSIFLRYRVDTLPQSELDARWYFTTDSLPQNEEVTP